MDAHVPESVTYHLRIVPGFVAGIWTDAVVEGGAAAKCVRLKEIIILVEIVVAKVPEVRGASYRLGFKGGFRQEVALFYQSAGGVGEKVGGELSLRDIIYDSVYPVSFPGIDRICDLYLFVFVAHLCADFRVVISKILQVVGYVP